MIRTLLALTSVAVVLAAGPPAGAVTPAECSIRHAICKDSCNKDRSCERRCTTRYQQCMFKAH
jgi:hypothetical protein